MYIEKNYPNDCFVYSEYWVTHNRDETEILSSFNVHVHVQCILWKVIGLGDFQIKFCDYCLKVTCDIVTTYRYCL